MSVFVYDYDHNAPTLKHLEDTHERMFLRIREKHPTLPIVMMTKPRSPDMKDLEIRKTIIKRTYDRAVGRGDKNVYLIYGTNLFDGLNNEFTTGINHPNDLGFWAMAHGVLPLIKELVQKNV